MGGMYRSFVQHDLGFGEPSSGYFLGLFLRSQFCFCNMELQLITLKLFG